MLSHFTETSPCHRPLRLLLPPRSILGLDVHKDSITIAVLPNGAKAPTRLERLPNDLPRLKRFLDRCARDGVLDACYEASGAGYVLHRALREWGYACTVIAPSLIPQRVGTTHRRGPIPPDSGTGVPRHILVKRVTDAGTFRFQQHLLYIANALVDQYIGLEETDDGVWAIYSTNVLLATLDERDFLIRG